MRSDPLPPELRAALDAEPDGAALERVWHLLGETATPDAEATEDAWSALRDRLDAGAPRTAPDRPAARPSRRLSVPAALVGAALVAVFVWVALPVTHRAPIEETLDVVLSDGSTAVLNSGSTLRHARLGWGEREVVLLGEAFFEVQPSDVRFVVETHNARLEVLGTAFNVRAWEGDAETAVALVEGRVRITGRGGSASGAASRELSPGEAVVVRGTEAQIEDRAVNVAQAASWREGAVAFEDLPLRSVLREVERRYGVAFDVAPGAPVTARVSAYYAQAPALDALLGDLGAATGVRFTAGAEGYLVLPTRRAAPPSPPSPTTAP